MRFKDLLTGPLGRLLLTALTIAVMALLTRGLRSFIEHEALSVVEEEGYTRADSPRLLLEVNAPEPVHNVLGPSKYERAGAVFSRSGRSWICVPTNPKPIVGESLAI